MFDKIKNLIAENSLEEAKIEIQKMELSLSEEISKNRQCVLKSQIENLKRLYFSKISIKLDATKEREKINTFFDDQKMALDISNQKTIICNKENTKLGKFKCLEAKVDCSKILLWNL